MARPSLSDITNIFTIYASAIAIVAGVYLALLVTGTHDVRSPGAAAYVQPVEILWDQWEPPTELNRFLLLAHGASDQTEWFTFVVTHTCLSGPSSAAYWGRDPFFLVDLPESCKRWTGPTLWEFLKERFPTGVRYYALVIAINDKYPVETRIDAIKAFRGVAWETLGEARIWNEGKVVARDVRVISPDACRGRWDKETLDVPVLPEDKALIISFSYRTHPETDLIDARKELDCVERTEIELPPRAVEEIFRFDPKWGLLVGLALPTAVLVFLGATRFVPRPRN